MNHLQPDPNNKNFTRPIDHLLTSIACPEDADADDDAKKSNQSHEKLYQIAAATRILTIIAWKNVSSTEELNDE